MTYLRLTSNAFEFNFKWANSFETIEIVSLIGVRFVKIVFPRTTRKESVRKKFFRLISYKYELNFEFLVLVSDSFALDLE